MPVSRASCSKSDLVTPSLLRGMHDISLGQWHALNSLHDPHTDSCTQGREIFNVEECMTKGTEWKRKKTLMLRNMYGVGN